MKVYAYSAIDLEGKIHKGRMEASDPADLERRLKKFELDLLSAKPSARYQNRIFFFYGGYSKLAWLCRNLSRLTRQSIPLRQAVDILKAVTISGTLREACTNLLEGIYAGLPLTASFARASNIFDPVFVAMIQLGEQQEKIPRNLKRLSGYLKSMNSISRLKCYLWFMLLLIFSNAFLLTAVFLSVFATHSRQTSFWLLSLFLVFIALLCAAAILLSIYILKRTALRIKISQFIFSWKPQRELLALQFFLGFNMLCRSGAQPADAVYAANCAIENEKMGLLFSQVHKKILQGTPIHQALMQSQLLDTGLNHLITLGHLYDDPLRLLVLVQGLLEQRFLRQTTYIKKIVFALFGLSFFLLTVLLAKILYHFPF